MTKKYKIDQTGSGKVYDENNKHVGYVEDDGAVVDFDYNTLGYVYNGNVVPTTIGDRIKSAYKNINYYAEPSNYSNYVPIVDDIIQGALPIMTAPNMLKNYDSADDRYYDFLQKETLSDVASKAQPTNKNINNIRTIAKNNIDNDILFDNNNNNNMANIIKKDGKELQAIDGGVYEKSSSGKWIPTANQVYTLSGDKSYQYKFDESGNAYATTGDGNWFKVNDTAKNKLLTGGLTAVDNNTEYVPYEKTAEGNIYDNPSYIPDIASISSPLSAKASTITPLGLPLQTDVRNTQQQRDIDMLVNTDDYSQFGKNQTPGTYNVKQTASGDKQVYDESTGTYIPLGKTRFNKLQKDLENIDLREGLGVDYTSGIQTPDSKILLTGEYNDTDPYNTNEITNRQGVSYADALVNDYRNTEQQNAEAQLSNNTIQEDTKRRKRLLNILNKQNQITK